MTRDELIKSSALTELLSQIHQEVAMVRVALGQVEARLKYVARAVQSSGTEDARTQSRHKGERR